MGLLITRRTHEALVITTPDGTRMEITVQGVQGNQVRLDIAAPRSVIVDRYEVDHRKTRMATGEELQGQEPRGPNWIDYRERQRG